MIATNNGPNKTLEARVEMIESDQGVLALTDGTESTISDDPIVEPVLSPAGDRVVRRRQTGARAEILGDPHRHIWQQPDESLEAFEKRVKAAAEAARAQDFPPSER